MKRALYAVGLWAMLWATPVSALPTRALAQPCLATLKAEVVPPKGSALTVGGAGPACARLLKALQDSSAGPIDKGLAASMSGAGPEALRDYIATLPFDRSTSETGAHRVSPDPAALAAILAELPDPADEKPGFWQRLYAWIARLLNRDQVQNADSGNWLSRWLVSLFRSIPSVVGKSLVLAVFGLMLVLLGIVVFREVRAALTGRARAPASAAVDTVEQRAASIGPMPHDPAALLRWVIDVLASQGRLPSNPALTNWQLCTCLADCMRPRFVSLILSGERALFGQIPVADDEYAVARADATVLTAETASSAS